MNFDYSSVYYMVQTTLPLSVDRRSILEALEAVRDVSLGDGYGHPGITSERAFLAQLDRASCDEVKDDVINVPYYDSWREGGVVDHAQWFPVLREDGFVGIFRDESDAATALEHDSGVAKYFIVALNALAYFVCDQLRVLVETNAKNWTWEQWKNSAEVKRATEFSVIVAKTVCERVNVALDALEKGAALDVTSLRAPEPPSPSGRGGRPMSMQARKATSGPRSPLKQSKPPLITTFNIFNPDPLRLDTDTISYDSGVVRSSCWSKDGTLTRVTDADTDRFVWIKNMKCENGHWATKVDRRKRDVLIAAAADGSAVDDICSRLTDMPEFDMKRVDLVSIE